MPKEYIERGALIDELEHLHEDAELSYLGVYDCVKTIPTADVVEVVRCKDCENCKTCTDGEKYCELHSDSWGAEFHYVDDDGYCSYGERKDEK